METSTLQFTEDMKQLLKDCIGKNLKEFSIHHYEHQKKVGNSTHYNSFQNAWLNIEGETYNIHNEYTDEPRKFFNSPESKIIDDTPCFGFFKRTFEETPYMQESFVLDTISVGEKK